MRSDEDITNSIRIGKHTFRMEQDIIYADFNIDISEEESIAIIENVFAKIMNEFGYMIVLSKATGTVSAKARKRVAEWLKNKKAAFININFGIVARTIMSMITRAMKLMGSNVPIVLFVNSDEEARAAIPTVRMQLKTAARGQ